VSAHSSYTSLCWLVWTAFHSSGCHISSVRSDGLYPDSFFLSGCLEPLFHCWVPFPCIHLLLLSVSFILMHIPQSHNHRYTVSHDVLRLCVVSIFCMSYLVCDAFQDAWCVLSYFGNFHCVDVSHSETIEVTLPHLFLMHRFYSISLWWLFFSPGTCSIDAVPDYVPPSFSMSSASVLLLYRKSSSTLSWHHTVSTL